MVGPSCYIEQESKIRAHSLLPYHPFTIQKQEDPLDDPEDEKEFHKRFKFIEKLGNDYAQRNTKLEIIQAAGLYNFAYRCAELKNDIIAQKRILNKLAFLKIKLITAMTQSISSNQFASILRIIFIYLRIQIQIAQNKDKLAKIRNYVSKAITFYSRTPEEALKIAVTEIYHSINMLMQAFMIRLLKQSLCYLGPPPPFALIAFGSMAREEMTHYSDFEFAILIREEKDRDYFRNLTYLLHFSVVNLGETILPALNIPELRKRNFYDNIIPRGFAFDGAGVKGKGCMTPLGNYSTFELIQTPEVMASYLSKLWLEKEPYLPLEIVNFIPICGTKDFQTLTDRYRKAVTEKLNALYSSALSLRQYLATVHLKKEDRARFHPRLTELEREGQLIRIKEDLYRFVHLEIHRLSLFNQVDQIGTLSCIQNLNKLDSFSKTILQDTVSKILWRRLKIYSLHERQREYFSPVKGDNSVEEDSETLATVYKVIYCFYTASEKLFQQNEYINGSSLASLSPIDLGHIYTRLSNYEQAKNYYQQREKSDHDTVYQESFRLNCLGIILYKLEEQKEAIEHFNEALKPIRETDPLALKISCNLAAAYRKNGEFSKSITCYQELQKRVEAYASQCVEPCEGQTKHHLMVEQENGLGAALLDNGQFIQSKACFHTAIQFLHSVRDTEHFLYAESIGYLGLLNRELGHFEKSLSRFKKAHKVLLTHYGETHPVVGNSFFRLGTVFQKLSIEKANICYQKALSIYSNFYGKCRSGDLYIAEVVHFQGKLNAEKSWQDQNDKVACLYRTFQQFSRVEAIYQKKCSLLAIQNSREYGLNMLELSILSPESRDQKFLTQSYQKLENSLKLATFWWGKDHLEVGKCHEALGRFYSKTQRIEKAIEHLDHAKEIYKKLKADYLIINCLFFKSTVYKDEGQQKEAEQACKEGLNLMKQIFSQENPPLHAKYSRLRGEISMMGF